MGFVARKSFKVMPGVRMTVSKSGLSASAGVRGARVSANSKGQVRRTVGVPGTGLYNTKRIDAGAGKSAPQRRTTTPATPAPAVVKPGLMAPRWEKALYKAIQTGRFQDLHDIAQAHPVAASLITALDGIMAMSNGDHARALEALRYAWAQPDRVEEHPFVRTYLSTSHVTINIAEGVSATLPISRDAIGLTLVELEQDAGNLEAAITAAEQLEPSALAAVSLCELYLEVRRYEDVVATTNQLTNDDDPSCLLLAFRGVAFREQGMATAAREAFREALKSRSRDAAIRNFALVERAKSYAAEGKNAMARKDLERVLAQNANYPGVRELMDEIEGRTSADGPEVVASDAKNPVPEQRLAARSAPEVSTTPEAVAATGSGAASGEDRSAIGAAPGAAVSAVKPSPEHSNVTPQPPASLPAMEGYGVQLSFDGREVRVVAENSITAVALSGSGKTREIVVPLNRVWSVNYSSASRLVNGNIDIKTTDGSRYQIHFRWGQRNQPWQELAEMLVPR